MIVTNRLQLYPIVGEAEMQSEATWIQPDRAALRGGDYLDPGEPHAAGGLGRAAEGARAGGASGRARRNSDAD